MLIISTRPVAPIMNPVSAASIFGPAAACASAGVASVAKAIAPALQAPRRATISLVMRSPPCEYSERFVVGFAGADADGAIEVVDKDFPVADLAGLGRRADRRDRLFFQLVGDRDFDLELGQEIHGVFGAAINFGVALLPAEAFDLGDGHAVHADQVQ